MRSARLAFFSSTLFVLAAAACGGGGDDTGDDDDMPDAGGPVGNPGFIVPDETTKAFDGDTELGEANWDCLNTPTDDIATTVAITLTGVLNDFQNNDTEIRDATVTVFQGIDYQNPDAMDGPTGVDGTYTLTLPSGGGPRWGFKVSADDYMDTFLLNQYFEPGVAAQSLDISAISSGLATALPAFIGINRTPGTGVLAGAIRDCDGFEVANAIATVSTTSGSVAHLEGAQTFYLDNGTSLPVKHDQLAHTDASGIFAIFELPVTASTYLQIWGFTDAADVAQGEAGLTLLSELESPVVADTVITGSYVPLRD
jgi:hypothetical protein